MQPVIVRAGAQLCKALPDGGILHAGNPQPFHGLGTARQAVDGAEDKLALPPGVAGVDYLGHVLPPQQGAQHVELVPLILGDGKTPGFRQNGQVIIAPLGIVGIIGGGIRQPGQVPQAPGHQPAVALQVAVFVSSGPQHSGQGFCHRGLLSDHKAHLPQPPFLHWIFSAFWKRCCHRPEGSHNRRCNHNGTAFPAGR